MRNKLFRKFYLISIAAVVGAMIIMMMMLSFTIGNYLTEEKRTTLTNYCEAIAEAVSDEGRADSSKNGFMRPLMSTGKVIDANVLLVDISGKIMYCSCETAEEGASCSHVNKTVSKSTMNTVLKGNYYNINNLDGVFQEIHHSVGMPIVDQNGSKIGVLFASSPASLLEKWIQSFSKMIILCAILPLFLTFVVIYISTSRILKPIKMMSNAARSLSHGDFSKRVYCKGDDEIAELAKSFNQMTDSLVQLESMRRSFVANVSHELRTPMTTIGGFIDGILDGTIPPEKHGYYLSIVSDEVKRLTRVVQSMLSLSRLESGEQEIKKTEIDIYRTVCEVLISQEKQIVEKNISVIGLEDYEKILLTADKDLLYQVVFNLIDNAIKFTSTDGYIKIGFEADESKVKLFVRNSGEGIAEKDLPKVFERFFKVDKSRSADKKSSGLGLYIVKSIIDLHKGTITVRSVVGEYTEFEVVIPVE